MTETREQELPANVHAVVFGSDQDGTAFVQEVEAVEISPNGACVRGLKHQVCPGSLLTLQCGNATSCLRVVWIGERGTSFEGLVGLRWTNYAKALTPETWCEAELQDGPSDLATTIQ
jgi:hypothetical protein